MSAQAIDFSKYEQAAPAAAIDFSKYEQPAEDMAPPGVPKPALPRALAAPTSDNRLTWSGDAPKNPPVLDTVANMLEQSAKGIYQASIPGVAASLTKHFAPSVAAKIPQPLQGAEPNNLARTVATQDAMYAAGAIGEDLGAAPPTVEQAAENRARAIDATNQKLADQAKPPAGSAPLPKALKKMLLRRIPGVSTASDLLDLAHAIQDHLSPEAETEAPAPAAPAPPAAPSAAAAPASAPAIAPVKPEVLQSQLKKHLVPNSLKSHPETDLQPRPGSGRTHQCPSNSPGRLYAGQILRA